MDDEFPSHPMTSPVTAPWNLPISTSDITKLTAGLESHSNDDKWRVKVRPHVDRPTLTSAIFERAGLRRIRYILHLDIAAQRLDSITWEQKFQTFRDPEETEEAESEEAAKQGAVFLARAELKCDIDALPESGVEGKEYNDQGMLFDIGRSEK